ncbi:hypothetical protein FQN49_007087 [Arthroderma sp. PD_2]|nr:hypothetical protein FQN49_007087 [Arthroderma sp. PD_2]
MVNYAILPLVAATVAQAGDVEWHHSRQSSFNGPEIVGLGCTSWVNVVKSNPKLTCDAFLDTINVTKAQFLSWNPKLNSKCDNIKSKTSYCAFAPEKPGVSHTGREDHGPMYVTMHNNEPRKEMPTTKTPSKATGTMKPPMGTGMAEPPVDGPFMPPHIPNLPEINGKMPHRRPTTLTKKLRPTGVSKRDEQVPTGTGTVAMPGCKQHHTVKAGDTCAEIAKKYSGLTLDQFFKMNPYVGPPIPVDDGQYLSSNKLLQHRSLDKNCLKLQVGDQVCVGGNPTIRFPVPSATPAITARGVQGWPSPTKPGTDKGCKKFEMVKKGDSCEGVSSKHHISVSQLKQWNPAVGPTCEKLEIGYYACVGV